MKPAKLNQLVTFAPEEVESFFLAWHYAPPKLNYTLTDPLPASVVLCFEFALVVENQDLGKR
jgi:hypothetical protein